jgi:tight adherence protein B
VTWVSVVAVALVVLLVVPHPGPRRLRSRLGRSPAASPHTVGAVALAGASVATAGLVTLVGWGAGAAAVVTSASLVGVTAATSVRSGLRSRAAARRAGEVARACDLLGSLVAIGHIPATALRIAAEDAPVLAPVAAAQRVGAEVPAALRVAGVPPGAHGLVRLAQAWEVGERTGAPMGQALAAVAEAVRRDHAIEEVVATELAGPRASGQVLAVLPVLGLATGFAMGGEPLAFFTTGIVGPGCLVAGTALACLGVVWTDVLVAGATPAGARNRPSRRARS